MAAIVAVAWAQLTVPTTNPGIAVSWAELSAPAAPVKSPAVLVSWAELETPPASTTSTGVVRYVRISGAWYAKPTKVRSSGTWT